jgi:multiple sugar transport system substrate-binding protein
MSGTALSRRTFLGSALGAAVLAGTGGLAACSPASGPAGGSSGPLRFTFWGPTFYQEFTKKMVDGFTAASGTQVAVEPTEWTAYWDKLATQTAAGDEPDVINMDGKYLAEYGARGALADLGEGSGIDVSGLSQADLDAGRVEGKLHAISTGSNAFAVMANPTLFKQAGVELPDDRTWTWGDYAEIGKQLRGGDVQGISGGGTYADLTIFLRQHGEDLFSGKGVGYRDETLAAWFDGFLQRQKSGAALNASASVEDGAASLESQLFSVNKAAMTWMWTNQLQSLRDATGHDDITMLRPPSVSGAVKENGLFLKASMFWSIATRSKQPEQAAQLVNYLINDPGAAKVQLLNRGVPSDPDMLAVMESGLTDTDRYVVKYLNEVTPELSATAPALQPVGASDSLNTITRYLTEVRFERLTPAQAAAKTTEEISAMIASAQ